MDIICRPARVEDYEGVVNIDTNIYDGLDYLPARYHFYFSSPNHYPFVLEKNGQIVAFTYKYVVDDGTAVVGGAGRARADLRGEGLMTQLGQYANNEILRLRPNAARRRLYTAGYSPIQEKLVKNGAIKVLLHRVLKHYSTTMDSVQGRLRASRYKMLAKKYNVDQVTAQNKGESVKLMMASPELFPGDCFIAYWEPYRPMLSNFNYVAEHIICHITPSEQGKKAIAVSFLFHHPCKAGLRLDMEFYGTDPNHLIQHYLKSLLYLSSLNREGDIQYMALYPFNMNSQQFQNVIDKEFAWKKGELSSKYQSYIAAEHIAKNDAKL